MMPPVSVHRRTSSSPPNILIAPQNRNFVRNVIRCFYNYLLVFFENRKIRNNKKLFTMALTIPISSVTCEGSFSVMKKIKTWLSFSDLSILYIYKNTSKNIKSDDILNIFADTTRYLSLK
jgi:hypothetical protein